MTAAAAAQPRTQPMPASAGYSHADDNASLVARARRRPLAVVAVVLFLALVVTLIWTSRPADYTPLSTENSTPSGTRALAQILREQGVDVRQVSTMANARIDTPATTTLAVADSEPLAAYQIDALMDYPGDLVLIDPSQSVVDRIAPALSVEPSLDA
ncbi:MAG: DUF4350 domain-containing protein, partial [Demequina sp.]